MRTPWFKHKFEATKLDKNSCSVCGFPPDVKHHVKRKINWSKKKWDKILRTEWKLW